MENIKRFERKYTLLFTLIFTILCVLISDIPLRNIYQHIFEYPNVIFIEGITLQMALFILCYLYLKKFDNIEFLGLKLENSINDIWVIWPVLIFIALNSLDSIGELGNINSNFITIVLYLLMFLSTGFFEEILVRGVVLKLLLNKYGNSKKGIYICTILSSIIFGIAHFNGYFAGDRDFITTLSQVICAIFMGVLFAAVFLRTKSLWVTILLHGLVDAVGSVKFLEIDSLVQYEATLKSICITSDACIENILITLPFLICGLFFLRKVKGKTYIS